MRAAQESNLNPRYQANKEVSFDKYDSESDIEDQLREEAEIKRIITEARKKKAANKPKAQGFGGSSGLTDFEFMMQTKSTFRETSKVAESFKVKNPRGFRPDTLNSTGQLDGDDKIKSLNKMLNYRNKINSQAKSSAKTQGFYNIEIDTGFEYNKEGLEILQRALTSPKSRFPRIIATSPKDQEFHKQSFNSLLTLYNHSTSHKPTKLFTEKLYFPCDRTPLRVEKANNEKIFFSKKNSLHPRGQNQDDANLKPGIKQLDKDIKGVIYDLISAILLDAFEPFDKRNPEEIPRMKMMDWASILKRTNASRFELLIMNPITFSIEEYQEIVSENPQEIKDFVHGAIRELLPTTNEAKHILVFYYEKGSTEKKLLFHKFFYFLKNHKYYLEGFKNEKEIITYYLIILSLLQLRITYENNPFKDDKIEIAQKKAKAVVKNNEELSSVSIDWFIQKVQHFMAIEKAYINLNVGGKADSNFSFSLHEHFTYTFPKYATALHGPKVKKLEVSARGDSRLMTSPFSPKAGKASDREACARMANVRLDTSKEFRGTHTSSLSVRRAELSPAMVDFVDPHDQDKSKKLSSPLKVTTNKKNELAKLTLSSQSPFMTHQSEQMSGKKLLTGGFIPSKFGNNGSKELVIGKNDFPYAIHPPPDNKKKLDHERMNTSYSELIKKRSPKAW